MSGENPFRTRIYYDDADMAAFVLRGVNANMGRTPGPEAEEYEPGVFDQALATNTHPPLTPRYFLEYPHAALYLFRLVMTVVPREGTWPSTVLDRHYANIIFHRPQNEDERKTWMTFRRGARVILVINVLALMAMMLVLLRGLGPNGEWSGPVWLLALPASLYFTMSRFDTLPSLFVMLGLAAAGRDRRFTSGFCLGIATALKLYPLVIAPLIWRHMTTDVKTGIRWALGFLTPLVFIFGSGMAMDGIDGLLAPFKFQLGRKLEPDWVLYGRLLPMWLTESSLARLGILAIVAAVMFFLKPGDMGTLLRRCAIVLIVFASLQMFFSPQWLLWFVPLLVPLARRSWLLLGLVVAFDLLTYVSFPVVYDLGYLERLEFFAGVQGFHELGETQMLTMNRFNVTTIELREVLIYSRGVLLIAMLAWLAWREVVTPRPASNARP